MDKHFLIGMDVGSTTVKAVVIDAATDEIVWSDYQRHDTKQPEKVLEFCKRFETEIEGFDASRSRMFVTGSGGNGLTKEFDVERYAREAIVIPIPDGTTEIQKLVISRALTGIAAFG